MRTLTDNASGVVVDWATSYSIPVGHISALKEEEKWAWRAEAVDSKKVFETNAQVVGANQKPVKGTKGTTVLMVSTCWASRT